MKTTYSLFLAAILVLGGVLSVTVPAVAAGIDDNGKVLAKLDGDWSAAAARRDARLVASFYAEDAVVYPPGGVVIIGRPAAEKFWAAGLADPTYSISWKSVSASVSRGGDLGFTCGTYEESYKGSDGKSVRNTGKYVTLWAKDRDGNWKSIHDIWNADK
jgi:ketosteroid isomerase-like protein